MIGWIFVIIGNVKILLIIVWIKLVGILINLVVIVYNSEFDKKYLIIIIIIVVIIVVICWLCDLLVLRYFVILFFKLWMSSEKNIYCGYFSNKFSNSLLVLLIMILLC